MGSVSSRRTRDRRRPRTRWDPRSPEGRPSPLLRRRTRARRAAPGSEPGWGAGSARRRRAPRRRPMMRSKGIRSRALAPAAQSCHAPEHPPRTPSRLALRMGSFFWPAVVSAFGCPFRFVPLSGGRVWVLGPPLAGGGPSFWSSPCPETTSGRPGDVNISDSAARSVGAARTLDTPASSGGGGRARLERTASRDSTAMRWTTETEYRSTPASPPN